MLGYRNNIKEWDDMEFLRITKPLALLLYFYKNNFKFEETLEILKRVDNFNKNNYSKVIISLIFVFANQAYHFREKCGLLKTLHLLRYSTIRNIKFQFQNAWDDIQTCFDNKKLNFTFDELEEILQPNQLFLIYGFNDIQPNRFNYIAKKQTKYEWFENNFFYFYNSIHISKISILLKDLDEYNPGFPFGLFKTYLLAIIFSNRSNTQVIDIIDALITNKKLDKFDILIRNHFKIIPIEFLLHLKTQIIKFYHPSTFDPFLDLILNENIKDFIHLIYFKSFSFEKDLKQILSEKPKWEGYFYFAKAMRTAQGSTLIEKLIILLKFPYPNFNITDYLSGFWYLVEQPINLTYFTLQFLCQKNQTMDNLIDLFHYLMETKEDLNGIICSLYPFIPIQLLPFFDLVLYYHNCYQIGMDILTSLSILNSESKEITTLLYERSKKSPIQSYFIEQIKNNLFHWKYSEFWNHFGYTFVQLRFANRRAQLDYDINEKNTKNYENAQMKKLEKLQKSLLVIIENASNYAENAIKYAKNANYFYLLLIVHDCNQIAKNTTKYAQLARHFEKKTNDCFKKFKQLKKPKNIPNNNNNNKNKDKEILCNAKERLILAKDKALTAYNNAFLWSKKASVFANLAHNFEHDITKQKELKNKVIQAIKQCRNELILIRSCHTLIGSCSIFTSDHIAKPRTMRKEYQSFLTISARFISKLDFIQHLDNGPAIYQHADLNRNFEMDRHNHIYMLIFDYCAENRIEFVIRNNKNLIQIINKTCQDLINCSNGLSKIFAKIWQRYLEIKNIYHFDLIFKLLSQSLNRFITNFNLANNNNDDYFNIILDIYDDLIVINNNCKDQKKWIKINSLPDFLIQDTMQMKIAILIWIKTAQSNKETLFEFLEKTYKNRNDVTKTLNELTTFQLDVELLNQITFILSSVIPIPTPLINQLIFLTEFKTIHYLQVVSDQLTRAKFPSVLAIHTIVLNYCVSESNFDIFAAISSVLKLVINLDFSLLSASKKGTGLFAYLMPLIQRLYDQINLKTKNQTFGFDKALLKIWSSRNQFEIPLCDRQTWVQKYSIPPGLQSYDEDIATIVISEWKEEECLILSQFKKKVQSIV